MGSESDFEAVLEFTTLSDANENAFTVDMPKGWTSKVSIERVYSQVRNCGVSVSPDGKTRLFFGDPSFPMFNLPAPEYGMTEGMQTGNPLSQVSRFIPAEQFFRDYAKMAFGKNTGFKIISSEPDKELQQTYEKAFEKNGAQSTITTAAVVFEYTDGTEKKTGRINGVAFLMDMIWSVDCSGFSTSAGKSEIAEKYQAAMVKSFKTNPQWREKENQLFAQRMETDRQNSDANMRQMTNAHNQRMSDMNSNFNAHQSRMKDMQASHDAYNQNWSNAQAGQNNQAWSSGQASNDNQHRRTIDAIRGEEQVSNGNQVGKVEAGYNHYYVNSSTGQYFGTNSQPQSTPENYQEWQIDN